MITNGAKLTEILQQMPPKIAQLRPQRHHTILSTNDVRVRPAKFTDFTPLPPFFIDFPAKTAVF